MKISGTFGLLATTCMAAVLLISTTTAQSDRPVQASPRLLSEAGLPAIDRGVRDFDPPRPPRGARTARAAGGAAAAPFLRGSIIVKFRPGTTATAQRAMLARVNGTLTPSLSNAAFDIVAIDPASDPEAVASRMAAQPDVEYAQARYRVYPSFVPNDPLYARQWNFPALDMERAWDINPGATPSIIVAVLDSGVAYRSATMSYFAEPIDFGFEFFPALGQVTIPFAAAPDLGGADRFVAPRDFIWDTTMPLDLDGHGTHVTGTVGQLTNNGVGVAGMAFNVRIMPVKVIDGLWDFVFGSPFEATDDVIARGVRYAVDNGARVLNMSIGRNGSPAPVVRDAVSYAVSKGAVVVLAGGNEFEERNPVGRFVEFAPAIDGAISVGATGRRGTRAFYSSTGPYIELVAPGGDQRADGTTGGILQQTYDLDLTETYFDGPARYRAPRFDSFAYDYFQGSSMAVPHVAGFAAMLMQQGITDPAAIEAIMKRFATDLGPTGRDDAYGYGLINPRAALRGLGLVR
ncbi:MAG: S8 family serine peptidase [Acidobacteria bacterium]|nr:S8 family serine peptidase [Acidobacteriota bacterium]